MLDFNNTEIAFSAKTTGELRAARFMFGAIKRPWMVNFGKFCTNIALAIHFPLGWILRPTLYKQFVGGETLEDCDKMLAYLMRFGVKSTLDFSAESKQTPEGIKNTFDETLHSIDNAARNRNVAYAVFKPSTLVTDALLSKASEKREPLTEAEKEEYEAYHRRFLALCRRAYDNDVRILVDAEDYCFQDSIDQMTDEAMRLYNKKRAIVFATLQMYRHDRMPYLERIYADAVEKDYIAGVKFVRGAYMEDERARAAAMGYPDPICPTKQATDDNYNAAVEYTVNHLDRMEMFMGTHNEKSNYLLAELMDKKGLAHDDQRIFFAQLLGMSDNISFNLAAAGYSVTKYVPYASVRDVLPYLIRRAEENTAAAGQSGRELTMIAAELRRRRHARHRK
ncbi:MAG: proline dehydrogenase family protein [Tidjanibacter sp.]|nr:proline dehydrogenase family protein [Tidjanibacter sp.]